MSLEQILDRLERIHDALTKPGPSDNIRVYRAEVMTDVLIAHVADTIRREQLARENRPRTLPERTAS